MKSCGSTGPLWRVIATYAPPGAEREDRAQDVLSLSSRTAIRSTRHLGGVVREKCHHVAALHPCAARPATPRRRASSVDQERSIHFPAKPRERWRGGTGPPRRARRSSAGSSRTERAAAAVQRARGRASA